jgi:TP901 family phage tail tape measure protein
MALETGGSLYWKTKIDNTGLQAGAVQAKGILRGLTRSITGMDVFAGLAIGATLIFSKITKQAYNFSRNFESAMKEVQTISKAVQDNFKGISKEIIDMTKTVPDNAQKLSKALYQIVSAGYDGAEAMDILRTSAELAVATVTDTFTAADALTYVMNAYGIAAGTAAQISDKLFTIVKLGKVKMEELGPTISMVTGLAAEAGLAFNELAAMYAEAVKKIQPHIVSTGIRGILTAMLRVSKGTGAAADKARELGIEFDITALKSKGFKQILNDIIVATKGNEGALMELFPNVRGLIGLLAVMTDEGEKYNKSLHEIENSLGATGEAFKIMMETTDNQFAIMKNNIMAKLKPLGDEMLAFMNNIARQINYVMSGANDELSKLSRTYTALTDTLHEKQRRIDNLVKTIEDLRDKTKLTKEETIQLKAAEEALAIYFPTLGLAAEEAARSIDILTLAKEGSFDLSVKIMELELERAKVEKKQAELELMRWEMEEDASNKAIRRIERQMEVRKKMIQLELGGFKGALLSEAQLDKLIKMDSEYLSLMNDLTFATETATLRENDLRLKIEETIIIVDAKAEALERLIKLQERPIVIEPEEIEREKPVVTPVLVISDKEVEDVKDRLEYMADQYKSYWKIVAQFGEEYAEEHNIQLAEDAKNYSGFLSGMLVEYKGIAELTKEIMLDIAEYNKGIVDKRKKAEEEYFSYISGAREKELEGEEVRFRTIIENYEEDSDEYLGLVEKHNKNILEIHEKYDKEIAEASLTIFKENLKRQIGEIDELYAERLRMAKAGLGEEEKANKEYFEFLNEKLQEITKIEEEKAKKKREILESYFESYQTIEEKIVSVHKKTAKLLLLTDDKYEKDRLKIIEKRLIAELKFEKAKQEIFEKKAEYREGTNKELEDYIKFLEKMKSEYSEYADIIILLNEKIAESQKQIWENTRDEIDKTIEAIHALADVVGNFDTELEEMINGLANLISGITDIKIDFSLGGIAGTLTGILGIINTIINLFVKHESDVPELKEELQLVTLELQKQQNILSQAIGTAKIDAIQDTIDLLNEQINVYNEMIEAEKEAYGQFLWWTWSETDQENINEWLSAIESVNAEIFNLQQQYQQILTGTTAETIADAIAEGFEQGLDSAQIFADTFNNMMKKAIIDAFKRTIITRYLQSWLAGFEALSAGGLTAEEIDILAQRYLALLQAAETQWETVQAILAAAGIDLGEAAEAIEDLGVTGLAGAIKGITEETAGLLAGQFQAIRINTVEMLSNMESIIIINARIADNTEYNKYLKDINDKLSGGTLKESEYLRGVGGA